MRRAVVAAVGLCVVGWAVPAGAGDAPSPTAPGAAPAAPQAAPAPTKPAPPPTPEQAADAVLAAIAARDDAALQALASKDDPDPWLVADALLARGQHVAAEAFATAAPRKAVEALRGYVATRGAAAAGDPDRPSIDVVNRALVAKDHEAVLARPSPVTLETVSAVRIAHARGLALQRLRRLDASGAVLRDVAEAAQRLGWVSRAAAALDAAGLSAHDAGDGARALSAWEAGYELLVALGDGRRAAQALGNVGVAHSLLGDDARALDVYGRALEAQRAVGDRAAAIRTRINVANAHRSRGEYAAAAESLEGALVEARALGDRRLEAQATSVLGTIYRLRGDPGRALEIAEQSVAAFEAVGERALVAHALTGRGHAQLALGDASAALASYERALAMFTALADRGQATITREAVAGARATLGDYAAALAQFEEVLATHRSSGDRRAEASTLANTASVLSRLGDHARARRLLEQALSIAVESGDRVGEAARRSSLGAVLYDLGEDEEAIRTQRHAAEIELALGRKLDAARATSNIGLSLRRLGRWEEASTAFLATIDAMEAAGDREGAARALSNLGGLRREMKDLAAANTAFSRALAHLAEAPNSSVRTHVLWGLGIVRLDEGDLRDAARLAREGVELTLRSTRGLADVQGASARDVFAGLFDVGVRACTWLADVEGAAWFFEQGSSSSWREVVGAGGGGASAEVPAGLLRSLDDARAEARRAIGALEAARAHEDLAALRVAQRAVKEAEDRVLDASARVERATKRGAPSAIDRIDDLPTMQRRLRAGEAYVACWLLGRESVALVVRSDGARVVRLAAAAEIEEAAEASRPSSPSADIDAAARRLRALVVTPLGLGEDVRQVLFAPSGVLGFVPPSVLWPDRIVVYVPSSTAYGLLAADGHRRGDGVLALGDPDYRTARVAPPPGSVRGAPAMPLTPLPATRGEAVAVGTSRLLGDEASEAALGRLAPTRERWRAVHFACHGLVDRARPELSALAITADGDDDGFLMVYEIRRLRAAADLVVLSACETGQGRVFRTEGIVGLTGAFLAHCAPRVISSLWKVDDAATSALMTEFYELWNPKDGKPGLPTAEALRKAQEFVRSQEKWKHPYYWAAWVLWGLPS